MSLDPTTQGAICDLVDNGCPVNLSANPIIIVFAYVAVFVPWGLLSLFDFITDRWKTVNDIRRQGLYQFILAPPTIAYTLYYVYVQAADREYTEMSAALVATFFSVFHFSRTLWGLLQLHYFSRWVKTVLTCMHQRGYSLGSDPFSKMRAQRPRQHFLAKICSQIRGAYSQGRKKLLGPLHGDQVAQKHGPASIHSGLSAQGNDIEDLIDALAENILLNSSVIDNEFFDTDVHCYFNARRLLRPWKVDEPWMLPRNRDECFIRWSVAFLVQYGTAWLEDSRAINGILNENKREMSREEFIFNLSSQASMIQESTSMVQSLNSEGHLEQAGCPSVWSTILFCRGDALATALRGGKRMPFGVQNLRASYGRYQSRIARLAENLPPEVFEGFSDKEFEVVKGISASDLENFVLFLHVENLSKLEYFIEKSDQRASSASSEVSNGGYRSSLERFQTTFAKKVQHLCSCFSINGHEDADDSAGQTKRSHSWKCLGKWVCRRPQQNQDHRDPLGVDAQHGERMGSETGGPEQSGDLSFDPQRVDAQHGENMGSGTGGPEQSEDVSLQVFSEQAPEKPVGSGSEGVTVSRRQPIAAKSSSSDKVYDLPNSSQRVLRYQLGLSREKQYDVQLLAHVKWSSTSSLLWSKTNVSHLSVHLDNFLALATGSQSRHLHPRVCLDMDTMKREGRIQFHKLFPGFRDNPHEYPEMSRPRAFHRANKCVQRETNGLLNEGHPFPKEIFGTHEHLCSLRFSGCVMESIRQLLAEWTDQHSAKAGDWNPVIPVTAVKFVASSELLSTMRVAVLRASERQTRALPSELQDRWSLRARILWECQSFLLNAISQENKGPESLSAMILCMLAFPSLQTVLRVIPHREVKQPSSTLEDIVGAVNGYTLDLLVAPVYWVRSLAVEVRFWMHLDTMEMRIVSLAGHNIQEHNGTKSTLADLGPVEMNRNVGNEDRGTSEGDDTVESEMTFSWNQWRSAFEGRMEGIVEGIVEARVDDSTRPFNTENFIDVDVKRISQADGREYKLRWDGWAPHFQDVASYNSIYTGWMRVDLDDTQGLCKLHTRLESQNQMEKERRERRNKEFLERHKKRVQEMREHVQMGRSPSSFRPSV